MNEDLFTTLTASKGITPVNYMFLKESVMTKKKILHKKVNAKFYNTPFKTVTRHHKPISKIFTPSYE